MARRRLAGLGLRLFLQRVINVSAEKLTAEGCHGTILIRIATLDQSYVVRLPDDQSVRFQAVETFSPGWHGTALAYRAGRGAPRTRRQTPEVSRA